MFAEIARARPSTLIVVADGARDQVDGEAELCARARAVIEAVDWSCEVLTDFSHSNLGCRARVSSGLNFVFDHVEEAIILEDDCLPHPSFFSFCESLLHKYRDDEEVMVISGDNFHRGRKYGAFSYFFSRFVHVWGWASWRRAWKHYDVDMKQWQSLRTTDWLAGLFEREQEVAYWRDVFDRVATQQIDTWDYQWLFSCWTQRGLSITPEINLVSNIGFDRSATHTTAMNHDMANLPVADIGFPLRHPPSVERNREADEFETRYLFRHEDPSFYNRMRTRFSRVVNSVANR
ncbi:MAG: glycosyltransferase family 2 protein [Pyrinomonadaceae bacterium]